MSLSFFPKTQLIVHENSLNLKVTNSNGLLYYIKKKKEKDQTS